MESARHLAANLGNLDKQRVSEILFIRFFQNRPPIVPQQDKKKWPPPEADTGTATKFNLQVRYQALLLYRAAKIHIIYYIYKHSTKKVAF